MEKEGEGDGLLQVGTGGGGDSRIAAVYTGRHGGWGVEVVACGVGDGDYGGVGCNISGYAWIILVKVLTL